MNQAKPSAKELRNSQKVLADLELELQQLKLKKIELDLKEEEQRKAKSDFKYFFEEVLRYEKKLSDSAHKEIIETLYEIDRDIANEQGLEKLLLLPRGFWKSSVFTIAGTNWLLTKYPNLRILISNAVLDNARKFLDEIKRNFKKEKYLKVFGDVEGDVWRTDEIRLKTCTRTTKEQTIVIGSPTTSLVSQHFDYQICDDLVNRESVTTSEQIEKTKQYWRDLVPLGQGSKTIRVGIGTRWSYADLYGWLIEEKHIAYILKTIYADEINKRSSFPEEFPDNSIEILKGQLGSRDFGCHYLNNPITDEGAMFKWEWLQKEFIPEELKHKTLNRYITIDTAESKNVGADFTGVSVIDWDSENNWFIHSAKRYKLNIIEFIDLIFNLWQNWKPQSIGIEKKALEDQLKPLIRQRSEETGVYPVIIELEHHGVRKIDRVRGALQGRFEMGKIFFRKDAKDDQVVLKQELHSFPLGKNDDLVDSVAYIQQIGNRPFGNQKTQVSSVDKEFYDFRKKQHPSGFSLIKNI